MSGVDRAPELGRDPAGEALERSAALVAVGRAPEAEAVVRRALADDPDHADLRTELARVLVVDDRAAEAVEHADRAVAAAPEDPHAHAIRALVLGEQPRRGRDAVAAARRAAELAPESAFAHRTVARACLAVRLLPDAQTAVDQAIRLEPEDADGHVLRGALLLERSRPVEAEAAFREALRLEPHDAGALNDLGVALQRQGSDRGPEAREAFEAAARARPGDALARENLAAEARSWVNGRWAWGLVVFASVKAASGLFGDATDRTAAVVWLVVALGLAGWLLVRGRQRRALLSPAAQRLLQDQGWRERTQVLSYRPWFWFVPAPIWLAVALVVALVCVVDAADGGGSGTWAVLAGSLVVAGLTGRRTWRRWGIPWWAGRRG